MKKLKLTSIVFVIVSLFYVSCTQEEGIEPLNEIQKTESNLVLQNIDEGILSKKIVYPQNYKELLADALKHITKEKGVSAKPGVLVVPNQYATIQAALNAANEGDKIRVKAQEGGYIENVIVVKNGISIIALEGVLLNGGIIINANNVTVSGFTIEIQNGDLDGILSLGYSSLTIKENTINSNYGQLSSIGYGNAGISLFYTASSTIKNNTITNLVWSINAAYSEDIAVLGNTILAKGHNNFSNGEYREFGIQFYQVSNSKIKNNKVTGSGLRGLDIGGINLYYGSNNRIEFNSVTNFEHGIWCFNGENETIYRNNSYKNVAGITFRDQDNSRLIQNQLLGNEIYGIYLYENANENLLKNNIAYFNGDTDIYETNDNCGNNFISNYAGSEDLNGSSNCNN